MKKLFFFIIIALVLGAYFWVSSVANVPVGPKKITITAWNPPAILYNKLGMDIASWRFKAYMKLYQASFKLQSGTYEIPKEMPFLQALQEPLARPSTKDLTITILPGWNIADVDMYLTSLEIIKTGDLRDIDGALMKKLKQKYVFLSGLDTLEGVLYPDTFRIRPDADLEDVLNTLLGTFQSRIYNKIPTNRKKDFISTLKLASILEKEERNPDNKAIVAGILSKRIQLKIPLGADATLCYVKLQSTRECTPSYIVEQLTSTSSYNTRKYAGFPPTPVANPSKDTWLAALNPESSEYLYYLHDDRGDIHYARTNEEHNLNRVRYLGK